MLKKNIYFLIVSLLLFSKFLMAAEELSLESEPLHSPDFIAGYLKSKLEDRFPNIEIDLIVENGEVIIYHYPHDNEICERITEFLKWQQGYSYVRFEHNYSPSLIKPYTPIKTEIEEGNWLPELSPFFPTMLADPRIIGYSAGYRSYDRIFKTPLLPVSMGDRFSIYQFKDMGKGSLYLGIEAGVWAIFEAKPSSLALINADYYLGIPVTYVNQRFSARLRIYHESSHLGDELLVEKKYIHRLNPSMEAVDFYLAYDFNNDLTVFGGIGHVIRSDKSYRLKPLYLVYGFNYQINEFKLHVGNLEATPYVAAYFSNWQDHRWETDGSLAIGYQWDKLYGRKMRLSLEYHNGYSVEGQFSKKLTNYVAIRLIYGY